VKPTPIYSHRVSILTDLISTEVIRPPVVGWTTFGHPGATRLLSRSSESGRLAHAYLITGPNKVGKRTLALDIACMVNSEAVVDMFGEAPNIDLNSSVQAGRIRKGIHSDVRVIDPNTESSKDKKKSSGSDDDSGERRSRMGIRIDHIKDLIEDSATTPFEGLKKVFIIDGADLMNAEAANALLKTLEEPADDVMLILLAPSVESIKQETVISRCQTIDLRPVDIEVIEAELIERFEVEESQARSLSRLSRGCPGWAIDALNDSTIVDGHNQSVLRLAEIVTGNIEERFRYARQTGGQFRRDRDAVLAEMQRWLEWWRDIAMMRHKLDGHVTNTEWVELLSEIANQMKESQISAAVTSIQEATLALEANAVPQLTLEVLMLDLPWADPAKVPSLTFDDSDDTEY
jgi:DNA polymerase-3 subunit delta'